MFRCIFAVTIMFTFVFTIRFNLRLQQIILSVQVLFQWWTNIIFRNRKRGLEWSYRFHILLRSIPASTRHIAELYKVTSVNANVIRNIYIYIYVKSPTSTINILELHDTLLVTAFVAQLAEYHTCTFINCSWLTVFEKWSILPILFVIYDQLVSHSGYKPRWGLGGGGGGGGGMHAAYVYI